MKDKKRIYILLGHTYQKGICDAFAESYAKGARSAGHEVRLTKMGDMKFDPILHDGYHTVQELEPDLKKAQEDIKWAEHIVIIYPMWWSSMPADLKGFFDRAWLPEFAFRFHENGMGWDKLLKGKSGRVIITMDSWPLVSRLLFGDSTNEIGKAILGFSGIHPVHITKIGPVKDMSPEDIKDWQDKISGCGREGE